MMRIITSGPRGWTRLITTYKDQLQEVKDWLSLQLDLGTTPDGNVEAASSLIKGIDIIFASICLAKGIPYEVFLSSPKQGADLDAEFRTLQAKLTEGAYKVTYISPLPYIGKGCLVKQADAITNWVTEGEQGRVLMIKIPTSTVTQVKRANLPENVDVRTFDIKRVKKRKVEKSWQATRKY